MKTTLRLALSSAILVLAVWASSPRSAEAYPPQCGSVSGSRCHSPGSTMSCWYDYDLGGKCTCQSGAVSYWTCAPIEF